jgi:hypothetical protein
VIRFCALAATLLATFWATACLAVAGIAALAFAVVFPEGERHLAGRLMGQVLRWWGLVGCGALLLLVIPLLVIAWRQWRDTLRARSTVLILAVLAVAGLHAAAISTIQVAAERRDLLPERVEERTVTSEQRPQWERFQAAHRLSTRLFQAETLLCALIALVGAVVVYRDDSRG